IGQGKRRIAMDGFGGVLWAELRAGLEASVTAHWFEMARALLPETAINAKIAPYLGGDDPLFGKLCDLSLRDFYNLSTLPVADAEPTIIYGEGAALVDAVDFIIYVDVPKDEIQRRMRAKTITNLGASEPSDAGSMYKRFYFVDWQVLNRHKAEL